MFYLTLEKIAHNVISQISRVAPLRLASLQSAKSVASPLLCFMRVFSPPRKHFTIVSLGCDVVHVLNAKM